MAENEVSTNHLHSSNLRKRHLHISSFFCTSTLGRSFRPCTTIEPILLLLVQRWVGLLAPLPLSEDESENSLSSGGEDASNAFETR
jgi:hypothetical protein